MRTAALIVVLALVGCGAAPVIGETTQALNGHSIPPAGGWGTEPWLCSPSTWNPMTSTWPAHGWCQWQPSPTAGVLPWRVTPCYTSAPTISGSIDIYSENSFGGACARLYGDPSPGYSFDSDLIQVNGWYSSWTPPGGTLQFVGIKSMKVAPYTDVYLCEGPFTGLPGAACNMYTSIGISTFSAGTSYPAMIDAGGLFFPTAALRLGFRQP